VSMANGQAGSVCDELGARDRRHAPPAIYGQKRRRSQARPGPEVWIVSRSKIRLGNEDKSRTDLYLKTLTRAEKRRRSTEWTWPRE